MFEIFREVRQYENQTVTRQLGLVHNSLKAY